MSSREIAELTGKEHFNVLIDIRKMLSALEMTDLSFQGSYRDGTGRTLPMYALPKDLTITLVSGYSVPMRHRIVTRWMELEAKGQPQAPVGSQGMWQRCVTKQQRQRAEWVTQRHFCVTDLNGLCCAVDAPT